MEKNKILISTFNNSKNNYGAVFQAYGLSEFIKGLGYDPIFLNLEDRTGGAIVQKLTAMQKLKNFVAKVLTFPTIFSKRKRAKKFKQFTQETQKQVCYATFKDLEKNPPEADFYLSGSDQVWNPMSLHKELFLSFAPDDKPILSYAASMGNEKILSSREDLFAKYISRYDAVSVREDTMIDLLKKYTDKPIVQNIDPVFLMDKQKWEENASVYKKLKFDKFILAYLISWNKEDDFKLKKLKEELNLPLVLVTLSGKKKAFADQIITDASPREFLYLLQKSEMMVASSFHGVALSIVHNKPFIAVPDKTKGNRIKSMLRHFALESHDTLDFSMQNAVADYQEVNDIIEKDRIKAKEYLTECFNIEK